MRSLRSAYLQDSILRTAFPVPRVCRVVRDICLRFIAMDYIFGRQLSGRCHFLQDRILASYPQVSHAPLSNEPRKCEQPIFSQDLSCLRISSQHSSMLGFAGRGVATLPFPTQA